MKLNKKFGTLLASAALLGTGLFGGLGTVHAAEITGALDGADGVTVGQENGSENDATHITNADNNGTGQSTAGIGWAPGNLLLNQVPNFDFGTGHTLHGGQTVYPLLSAAAQSGARSLVVTDQRADMGKTEGWNVTLKLSDFKGADAETLPSTTTDPINLNLYAADGDATDKAYIKAAIWDMDRTTADPENPLPAYVFDANNSTRTDKPDNVLDTAVRAGDDTTAVAVWGAAVGNGAGTWGLNFDGEHSAELTVPDAAQKIGTWTAQMDWTLSSGPIQ